MFRHTAPKDHLYVLLSQLSFVLLNPSYLNLTSWAHSRWEEIIRIPRNHYSTTTLHPVAAPAAAARAIIDRLPRKRLAVPLEIIEAQLIIRDRIPATIPESQRYCSPECYRRNCPAPPAIPMLQSPGGTVAMQSRRCRAVTVLRRDTPSRARRDSGAGGRRPPSPRLKA